MDGAGPVAARTSDIGSGGVSATVAAPLQIGQQGSIMFEMLVDGKTNMIEGRVGVTYCILSHDGYKVGFQFSNLDFAVSSAIGKYMR